MNNSIPYLPHTDEDRKSMLDSMGLKSFEDLVSHIPASIRVKELKIPSSMSELELSQELSRIARKNVPTSAQASFLGGGSQRRYVPAAVGSICSRSEFATAYTPYQPEVSQGTLQVIYEFQTAVCLLTGMEVANASMYDGATAAAEACLMACRLTDRTKIALPAHLNPEYLAVIKTCLETSDLHYTVTEAKDGLWQHSAMNLDQETAAVVVQYPNFFGLMEPLGDLADKAHQAGALLVVIADPIALGVLTAPGDFGADIVVGDGQQCGNSLSFGGPSAGFLATRNQFVRQMPGRLCGMTVDNRGQRAFTLTLQTREQHIRRSKATSNICTNQSLNALAMLVYLTMMGPQGLKQVAEVSALRAHELAEDLLKIAGVKLKFSSGYLNEFVLESEWKAAELLQALKEHGILGGLDLGQFISGMENCLLITVTETNSPAELKLYAETLATLLKQGKSSSGSAKSTESAKVATKC